MANPSVKIDITAQDEASKVILQMANAAQKAAAELRNVANIHLGNSTSAIGANAKAFDAVSAAAKQYERNLKLVKASLVELKGLALGVAGAVGGIALVEGKKAVQATMTTEQARATLGAADRSGKELAAADRNVEAITGKYRTVSREEAYEMWHEMRSGAVNHETGRVDPEMMAPLMEMGAKFRQAAAASGIELQHGDFQHLMKYADLTGHGGNPRMLQEIFDSYLRGKQAFGPALTAEALETAAANAKSAGVALSPEQLLRDVMVRLTTGNAARIGNEYAQTFASFTSGKFTKGTIDRLIEDGLYERSQLVKDGGGHYHLKGGVKGQDLLASDPSIWATQVFLPSLKAAGKLSDKEIDAKAEKIKADEKSRGRSVSDNEAHEQAYHQVVASEINALGVKGTIADNLAHLIAMADMLERDKKLMENAKGLDAATDVAKNPLASAKEVGTSAENLTTTVLGPSVQNLGVHLDNLSDLFSQATKWFSGWQKEHPDAATGLGYGVMGGVTAGGGLLGAEVFSHLFGRSAIGPLISLFSGLDGMAAAGISGGGLTSLAGPAMVAAIEGVLVTYLLKRLSEDYHADERKGPARRYDQGEAANRANEYRDFNGVPFEGGWHRVGRGAAPAPGQPSPYGFYDGAFHDPVPPTTGNMRPVNLTDTAKPEFKTTVQVNGTVSGEANVKVDVSVSPSPLLDAKLSQASKPAPLQLKGNLGKSMDGPNGVATPPNRLGHQ